MHQKNGSQGLGIPGQIAKKTSSKLPGGNSTPEGNKCSWPQHLAADLVNILIVSNLDFKGTRPQGITRQNSQQLPVSHCTRVKGDILQLSHLVISGRFIFSLAQFPFLFLTDYLLQQVPYTHVLESCHPSFSSSCALSTLSRTLLSCSFGFSSLCSRILTTTCSSIARSFQFKYSVTSLQSGPAQDYKQTWCLHWLFP